MGVFKRGTIKPEPDVIETPKPTLPPAPKPDADAPRPRTGYPAQYQTFVKGNLTLRILESDKTDMVKNAKALDQMLLCANLIQAIAWAESEYKRCTRYIETGIKDLDAVTKMPNVSEGLLQLSYQDSKYYGAKFDWSTDKRLSVDDWNKTIFDPYKNLHGGILILDKLLKNNPTYTLREAGSKYWSTLRPSRDGYGKMLRELKKIMPSAEIRI